MARLTIERAPAPALPRRFLLCMPWWGMFAGLLLILYGDALLRSRWNPGTLALVHVFTLGVLGNAMFGSVLQFLPAAAGVQLRGLRWGKWLHGSFNLGSVLLVIGLHHHWRFALGAAGALLPASFLLLAGMTLPGLLTAAAQRLLRAGFVVALLGAVFTALLGGGLTLALGGWLTWPTLALTDVHASWGVLGWVVVLIATVSRVVMPMFQGTGTLPSAVQTAWLVGVVIGLPLAAAWRLQHGGDVGLRLMLGVFGMLLAAALLWLQWRAPRPRRGPLLHGWRAGLCVLLAASLALMLGDGRLAAALGLGIALPLLVACMAMEIVAFIGWIELHRHCGRGVQVPGVQRLLPDGDKHRALLAHVPLLLLPAALLWPSPWLARLAGAAVMLAWLGVWLTMRGVRGRARRFLSSREVSTMENNA
jgi:hypothetical protein